MVKHIRSAFIAILALAALPSLALAQTVDQCDQTAPVSVTAGNTTEIVPLASARTIYVCTMVLTMSAAGTAKFVYGTGTNCGTGTTDMTAAMALAETTPLAVSGMNSPLLRAPPANAICIAAVTGNVTGFINYRRF